MVPQNWELPQPFASLGCASQTVGAPNAVPLESAQTMPELPRPQTSARPSPLTSGKRRVAQWLGASQVFASLKAGPHDVAVANEVPVERPQTMPLLRRPQTSALPSPSTSGNWIVPQYWEPVFQELASLKSFQSLSPVKPVVPFESAQWTPAIP